MLAIVSFKVIAQLTRDTRKLHANSLAITKFYAINKALAHDLSASSCALDSWLMTERTKIKFLTGGKKISWKLRSGLLTRSVSSFDAKNNRWKKESTSPLSTNVHACTFTIAQNNDGIDYITTNIAMNISGKLLTLEQTVWPMLARVL
jgi:hypothetical protein